jgi:DNA invertase Pin-like site-specific DNA recombinase
MRKNDMFAYIRVSDTKQVDGASLSQQERSITEYAAKNHLNIVKWFEETQTAAKKGRPKFTNMMTLLKEGKAMGVIMHKIDRSARNLHDWAAVGDLIDTGIQVHFAHESLDMTERGGRLSADIQAVMASDYVRNLRQETIKGIYGRLNQGLYPFCAPIGYLNTGKGKIKMKDPMKYELMQKLFSLYATGEYNAKTLSKLMYEKGLRNSKGNIVNKNSLLRLLKNPFYIGIMKVDGKLFAGTHEAIISKRVFNKVQEVLTGRIQHKGLIHDFTFRKRIKCGLCNYFMSGEKQKGMVYYRCATKGCTTKTRREDFVEKSFENVIKSVSFNNEEKSLIKEIILESENNQSNNKDNVRQKIKFDIGKLRLKEDKLLEAYLENVLTSEDYQKKKNSIVDEIHALKQSLNALVNPKQSFSDKITNFLELSISLLNSYNSANKYEKRKLLDIVTSNFAVSEKSLYFSLQSPFKELQKMSYSSRCCLSRDSSRTLCSKNIHTDNYNFIIANEWTTLLQRLTLSKKELKEWCDFVDKTFEHVPSLDERLYVESDP